MVACMAVMAREAWTDERLDDLKENVNQRFDAVDKRFDQVDKRLGTIDTRLDSMQRTMIICFVTLLASIWASVIGAILAVLL
jgi:ABC-type proline/glycine betaine transport system permease subunit